MKATIETTILKKAFETVNKAAQQTVASNVYEGIYLYAHDTTLEIQGNNHYIGVRTEIDATVEEKGKALVMTPSMIDLVRKISADTVTLFKKEDETQLTITAGRSVFTFQTGFAEDFPHVDNIDNTAFVVIDSDQLKDMYQLTQFAVAGDNQKPIFSGLLLEVQGDCARMVATDTHRLACREVSLSNRDNREVSLIIPQAVLNDLVRLIPQEDVIPVTCYWARDKVAFSFDRVYFRSMLIDGNYPDYNRVFPKEFNGVAVLNRRELTAAMERVALISRDMTYRSVMMNWTTSELTLMASADHGSIEETVSCQWSGANMSILFNCFYILDILKRSTGDTIILHVLQNGPMLVEQEIDKQYRYIVTPMRGN